VGLSFGKNKRQNQTGHLTRFHQKTIPWTVGTSTSPAPNCLGLELNEARYFRNQKSSPKKLTRGEGINENLKALINYEFMRELSENMK